MFGSFFLISNSRGCLALVALNLEYLFRVGALLKRPPPAMRSGTMRLRDPGNHPGGKWLMGVIPLAGREIGTVAAFLIDLSPR
jgi:hypothetical protein